MTAILTFQMDDSDFPSKKQIQESFFLLWNFMDRMGDSESAGCKAYRKVVCNGVFTKQDFEVLNRYTEIVCQRIEEKYHTRPFCGTEWRDAVLQNVARLRGTMVGLGNLIQSCQP